MRHVTVLARDGVRLNSISLTVRVPCSCDCNKTVAGIAVGESVEINEHLILVNGLVDEIPVIEVDDNLTLAVDADIVSPVTVFKPQVTLLDMVWTDDACVMEMTVQLPAVTVADGMEVDEKIDDGGKEVLGGILEEGLTSAFLLPTALVEGFQQRRRRLGRCREIGNILLLDRIDAVGMADIGEVDDTEGTVFRQMTVLLVLVVVVKQLPGKCRELIVIDHHRKALGRMLADKGVNDAEGLTRAGSAKDKCTTERIGDVDIAVVHLVLVVEDHRYIDGILIADFFLRLLERFILEVETVIAYFAAHVLADGITSLVNEHDSEKGTYGIYNTVKVESEEHAAPLAMMDKNTEYKKIKAYTHGIYDHFPHIELQVFLWTGAYTRNEDTCQFHEFASDHAVEETELPEKIEDKSSDGVACGNGEVDDNLYNKKYIDTCTERVVYLLLFLCFLYCHKLCIVNGMKPV